MTTFLTILFVLLAINALLLLFSVGGAKNPMKKPLQDITKSLDTELFQKQYSETEYKEAV